MQGDFTEFRVAIALLRLDTAWQQLCDACKHCDTFDPNEAYPFYLLDFIEIRSAVTLWCQQHANDILGKIPVAQQEEYLAQMKQKESEHK